MSHIIPENIQSNTVIVVAGATAAGKTAFAIDLAKKYNTSIISADSRQCYKELNIGVAKPSSEQLNEVTHYFINSHSIHDEVNARTFESYALDKARNIFHESNVAIMVGGTGLYIKAFCEGLDDIPAVDEKIREEIRTEYKTNGKGWLQNELKVNDPVFFDRGEMDNPQRMMRALEVALSTGRSIIDYKTASPVSRPFDIIKIGLQLTRKELYDRINRRVDTMIASGLIHEVEQLKPWKHLNPLKTVGYAELFDFFEGLCSLDQAIEKIKINTRHYAKRQMTWFRRDRDIKWVEPD